MVAREIGRGGVKARIKEMVIDDPSIGLDDILRKLSSKSRDQEDDKNLPSRFMVESIRSDTRQTLRLLKSLGYLSKAVPI